jgi:predicted PurR-regulated permease PerM
MMMDHWTWMTSYGFAHLLIFAVIVALILYPLGRILRRIGVSPLWSVLVFFPLLNLIAIWVLAFSDWPVERSRGAP